MQMRPPPGSCSFALRELPFALTDPSWAAYNGARVKPRGAVIMRVALSDDPDGEKERVSCGG